MSDENIAYAAKVNAAAWLIRKARKIARLLGDRMPDEQQAIEEEIVAIGRKMYDEAWQQKTKPETTHDPGEDHELEAYVAAVRELVPDAERWFVANDYHHKFSVEQSAERWREYVSYSKGRAQR
jgi:hypothetical protein